MTHHILLGVMIVMTALRAPAISQGLRMSLDGEWLFTADSLKAGIDQQWYRDSTDRSRWQSVEVPRYWEGYPGLGKYDGWGWYARTFRFEKTAEPVSIYFAGVDDDAVVWINGIEVGSHTGYSDPFALDISGAVRTGENSIVVLVKDYGGGGGIYRPITLIETRNLDDMLKGPYYGKPALRSADWVRDAVIYSVYLRSFSRQGTFAGLEQRLPELKRLGVTVLWLMPIHPVGVKNRKGKLGSPYAVQDYYGINPEFGALAEFKHLLGSAHRLGLKLIIDLVANHTSWDSKLIVQHPEWFRKDATGNIVSPNANWTDVAQLDYTKPALRSYMLAMMRWWVKDVGIDGFRCDVAEMVPTDFWEMAREQLNRIKPVMMLSEGSLPEHHIKAFDLTYSWNIYDALEPLVLGKRPVALLDQILKNERLQFPVGSIRMRFVTNHDKNAFDMPAVLRLGLPGLRLATVLVNTIPGVPMIYTGEEVANDQRLSLFVKVDVDWSRPRNLGAICQTLFRLRAEHKALSRGEMIRFGTNDEQHVYGFIRYAGSDKILVLFNFGADTVHLSASIPLERVFPGRNSIALTDAFSGEQTIVSLDNGSMLQPNIEPYGYRVYVVE